MSDMKLSLNGIDVYCYVCGALPGTECVTPSGAQAKQSHQDRRADAEVITRHLTWMEAHK